MKHSRAYSAARNPPTGLVLLGRPEPGCPHSPLGLVKWITVSSLKMLTSSMPGMVFTPNRFKVFCSLLSSVEVVLWTAFFFL